MIVGNPASRGIMQEAYNAFRQHGLSVQGTIPAFKACRASGNDIVRNVFWRDALQDWCGVDPQVAYAFVEDMDCATRHPAVWRMMESAAQQIRAARGEG